MSGLLPAGINMVLSIFGIVAIGSIFAIISNCTIDRIPKNQSVIFPGPYCKSCAAKLLWKDIIPIWSYIHSKGKCPECENPIPLRNWIVDIAEIMWVAIFITKFGWSYKALLEVMFGMGLIAVIVIEKENRQLSNLILLLMGMLSTIYLLAFKPTEFPTATASFFIGAIILLAYNLLKILTKARSCIEFSEIKFGAILGLFLGFPQVLLCVFLSLFIGATVGSFRIKFQGKKHQSAIPDFPLIMAFPGLATILFGQEMLTTYEKLVAVS
jgi:leader peptidase (prepilin peptidase)/N-methyltransferase